MKVQVLGPGCAKCKALAANAEQAIAELGITAELEKVEQIVDIARMGVLVTPGLAIDGAVVSNGHLLSVQQIKTILADAGGAKPAG